MGECMSSCFTDELKSSGQGFQFINEQKHDSSDGPTFKTLVAGERHRGYESMQRTIST